jgi:hypothetical protein
MDISTPQRHKDRQAFNKKNVTSGSVHRNYIRVIKSRRMRWARHVPRMGDKRNACNILVVKPERKRPLARPRRRWKDNVRMDLREIGRGRCGLDAYGS